MRPEGIEKAPLFLLSCGRRHARAAELAASAARVLAGPTPVAGKAISVATLWLTALGWGALCAWLESHDHGATTVAASIMERPRMASRGPARRG
jgi:hypothetical protein